MKELLENYSLEEIIIFLSMLGFAIKGVVDFFEWAKSKILKPVEQQHSEEELRQKFLETLESHNKQIEEMSKSINILLASDKDDIKAWITEQHDYYCYKLGYIDEYHYQNIESRYTHYKEEKGNTFIDTFMAEIRALPKVAVIKKEKEE